MVAEATQIAIATAIGTDVLGTHSLSQDMFMMCAICDI
jgi:hypothetical protein